MTPQLAIFFVLAALAVLGALNLIIQRHPINSALSLIVVMIALAGLYLLMGSEFVAAVQIIVYGGAIMVLFVFVIMLLNAGEEEHTKGSRIAMWFGVPSVAALLGMVLFILLQRGKVDYQIGLGAFARPTREVAILLFRDYLLPFEVTSVLILVAIMGAVVLARREQ